MYIKKADKSHCDLLFHWANDELVRKSSFNKEKIKYEDHVKWFYNKLTSKNSYIYVAYIEDIPVGQIRIDLQGCNGIISYSICNSFRGMGYGEAIIRLSESRIKEEDTIIGKLTAYVKYENIPSQKIFEKLNYIKSDNIDKIEYYKFF